jgi:hypothetical protein
MLLSAAVGNGAQILILVIALLLLSLVGTFSNNPGNRGAPYTALVVLYFLTACRTTTSASPAIHLTLYR